MISELLNRLEAAERRIAALESRLGPEMQTCPGCCGDGQLMTECCNGASGCSCRGQEVYLGACGVCGGRGQVEVGNYDAMANVNIVRASCSPDGYLGTGGGWK